MLFSFFAYVLKAVLHIPAPGPAPLVQNQFKILSVLKHKPTQYPFISQTHPFPIPPHLSAELFDVAMQCQLA